MRDTKNRYMLMPKNSNAAVNANGGKRCQEMQTGLNTRAGAKVSRANIFPSQLNPDPSFQTSTVQLNHPAPEGEAPPVRV
jgi:hypothetical protein